MRAHALALDTVWQAVGDQLRNPTGLLGRLTGSFMGIANSKPNALAIAALGIGEGETLLELGCGPGRALNSLLGASPRTRVIGLDWSELMLLRASRRNQSALDSGRLSLVRGDFVRLPFIAESADAILGVNVAYFMRDSAAIREACRVLRPAGRIVLYATDRSAMRHWPFAGRHSHRLLDRNRLAALLKAGGFAADRIHIESVDAGFGVTGLLALARKEVARVPVSAAPGL